ncbi:Protein of unknown function [Gryllus bimaculatus]|nr:Protein of unknown function [Gryllus bimaculatus]
MPDGRVRGFGNYCYMLSFASINKPSTWLIGNYAVKTPRKIYIPNVAHPLRDLIDHAEDKLNVLQKQLHSPHVNILYCTI